MLTPTTYLDLSEVAGPGLYHNLGTDRIELWLERGGKLYVDGWIMGSNFETDEARDVFVEKWLGDVERREAAGQTP